MYKRQDLYHRLSVFTISVPPLRDMGRDRLLLLDHFRKLYAAQAQCQPFSLDSAAEALWLAYSFPGNVRELRNIVIRLTARHPGQTVTSDQVLNEFDTSDEVDRNTIGKVAENNHEQDVYKRQQQRRLATAGTAHDLSLIHI